MASSAFLRCELHGRNVVFHNFPDGCPLASQDCIESIREMEHRYWAAMATGEPMRETGLRERIDTCAACTFRNSAHPQVRNRPRMVRLVEPEPDEPSPVFIPLNVATRLRNGIKK